MTSSSSFTNCWLIKVNEIFQCSRCSYEPLKWFNEAFIVFSEIKFYISIAGCDRFQLCFSRAGSITESAAHKFPFCVGVLQFSYTRLTHQNDTLRECVFVSNGHSTLDGKRGDDANRGRGRTSNTPCSEKGKNYPVTKRKKEMVLRKYISNNGRKAWHQTIVCFASTKFLLPQ